jgi:hypothetical protein
VLYRFVDNSINKTDCHHSTNPIVDNMLHKISSVQEEKFNFLIHKHSLKQYKKHHYKVLFIQYLSTIGLIIWLSNLSIFSVPDEVYSRNVSCTLNLISTFLLHIIYFWFFVFCSQNKICLDNWQGINFYAVSCDFHICTKTCYQYLFFCEYVTQDIFSSRRKI